ncbi:pantoate--beta-alanine ligase [Sphingobacterium hungaricum]
MEIFYTQQALDLFLEKQRNQGKKVALVPTMGALHEGHISLIEFAKPLADCIVCSIFVNPTQFNDPKDLEKYPRPIERDIELLENAACDVLFMPSAEEMYPQNDEKWEIDLGNLDQIWEGEHRPGHFQGVTQIVYKLFKLVKPDMACFGQKDFQQVMVIQKMIDIKNLPVQLIICPTVRSDEGLALSSRNERLSARGLETALILSKTLNFIKANFGEVNITELKALAIDQLNADKEVALEYFAICETTTLEEAKEILPGKKYVALVVAKIDQVRLIDNMLLN